ncbi:hypothetical protein BTM460_15420 [Helicobacter pylori]
MFWEAFRRKKKKEEAWQQMLAQGQSLKKTKDRGWPRGRVVKFARSAAGGPVFR